MEDENLAGALNYGAALGALVTHVVADSVFSGLAPARVDMRHGLVWGCKPFSAHPNVFGLVFTVGRSVPGFAE